MNMVIIIKKVCGRVIIMTRISNVVTQLMITMTLHNGFVRDPGWELLHTTVPQDSGWIFPVDR